MKYNWILLKQIQRMELTKPLNWLKSADVRMEWSYMDTLFYHIVITMYLSPVANVDDSWNIKTTISFLFPLKNWRWMRDLSTDTMSVFAL